MSTYRIGIGITTRNRTQLLHDILRAHKRYLPKNSLLVIVDDASDPSPMEQTMALISDNFEYFRHDERRGIPRSKNRCLAFLQDCDYFILLDDDIYPTRAGWADRYIEVARRTGIHHFNLLHPNCAGQQPLEEVSHKGVRLWRSAGFGGPLLFYTKEAIAEVGAFNVDFGLYGGWHGGHSKRIARADLTQPLITPGPYGSVGLVCAPEYLHVLDWECPSVVPVVDQEDRKTMVERNNENSLREGSELNPIYRSFEGAL